MKKGLGKTTTLQNEIKKKYIYKYYFGIIILLKSILEFKQHILVLVSINKFI